MMTAALTYSPVAKVFHWLLALALLGSFSVGLYMADLPFSPFRLKLFNWHKWAGITILTLSLLRLMWRLMHTPPPEPPMPQWQKTAATVTHWALYALFFIVPLVGWAYSSAAGFPIVVFGLIPLPDFVSPDKALAEIIKPWHGYLAKAMAVLVLLHVAAAIKHQVIDKDGLLLRMLPARKN